MAASNKLPTGFSRDSSPAEGESRTPGSRYSLVVSGTQPNMQASIPLESQSIMPQRPRLIGTEKAAPAEAKIGPRGYLRLLRIGLTLFIFAARVFVNTRGWLGRGKTPQTEHRRREGERLRNTLIALGPTFIKIGQTLATRADILPIEYIQELSRLQDEVPPFPTAQARAIVERETGSQIDAIFPYFDDVPIAAASLGQVHRATLTTGESVVVKIQRPNLEQTIGFDITVLQRVARFLSRFPDLIRGVAWEDALAEFRATIFEEMDYVQEAQKAEVFRRNFIRWNDVYVPRIYHRLSTRYVIVMEYIPGLKVTDVVALRTAGQDPPGVVRLLAR